MPEWQGLIVHAHPEPASFNAALTRAAAGALRGAGPPATVSHLYAEGFDGMAGRGDFSTTADPSRFHYQSEQAYAAAHDGFTAAIKREQERVRQGGLDASEVSPWVGVAHW